MRRWNDTMVCALAGQEKVIAIDDIDEDRRKEHLEEDDDESADPRLAKRARKKDGGISD